MTQLTRTQLASMKALPEAIKASNNAATSAISEHRMNIPGKVWTFAASQDASLNKRAGWEQNSIKGALTALVKHGRVEIGWRESCGKTDPTMHVRRSWLRVVALLRKNGIEFSEERVKHGNGYATTKGGFWSSVIYRIPTPPSPAVGAMDETTNSGDTQ